MPRITAPTVAEHRAAQRSALVHAGEAVLRESGLAAVTPRAVCTRACIRASVNWVCCRVDSGSPNTVRCRA